MPNLTADFVLAAIAPSVWDLGNEILYKLCEKHSGHTTDGEIIAKVWLIGRAYAAAIERRRGEANSLGDAFYEEKVLPKIRNANVDSWLRDIRENIDRKNTALKVHKNLTNLFNDITEMDKRALASKYLHFHFPQRFFIYDTRAVASINKLTGRTRRRALPWPANVDLEYAKFFDKCEQLTKTIHGLIGRDLTPRELDNVLLAWHRNPRAGA